jgi:serine protease AprX
MKPDIAAPGNRIESLQAEESYLPATYPWVHTAGAGTNSYMRLSGTSMAAPMASGAIAVLLEGSPSLTASQIKVVLQSGATYMPDAGLTGAGTGSLDVWASRALATSGLTRLVTATNGQTPGGASFWDAGTLSARLYAGVGVRLLSTLDLLSAWTNLDLLGTGRLNLIGLLNPLRAVPATQMIWGDDVSGWSGGRQIIWGSTLLDSGGNQIIWGSNDQIIWGSTDVDQDRDAWTLTSANPR